MRLFFLISGLVALGLGVLGIFLPLLPTTPFILLSAFCFARSSEKFYNWLINHPRFGQIIKDWQEHGSISKKSKIIAMIVICLTLLLSAVLKVSPTVLVIQAVVLSMSSIFILTRPTSK